MPKNDNRSRGSVPASHSWKLVWPSGSELPDRTYGSEASRSGKRRWYYVNKLALLNRAARLDDLRVPSGNRLEALRGDRQGQYSVRINDQWRLCFRWGSGDAYDVEICDYH